MPQVFHRKGNNLKKRLCGLTEIPAAKTEAARRGPSSVFRPMHLRSGLPGFFQSFQLSL